MSENNKNKKYFYRVDMGMNGEKTVTSFMVYNIDTPQEALAETAIHYDLTVYDYVTAHKMVAGISE